MPDLGPPEGREPIAHLASPQWQSFEARMRARKAERCLQRASDAIENGALAEAGAALSEARELDPTHVRLQELSSRLDALKHPLPEPQTTSRSWTGVAAAFGLILVSVAGWEVWRYHPDIWSGQSQLTPSIAKAQGEIDESSGLAAAGSAAVPAAAPLTTPASAPSTAPPSDAIVSTQIVRPEPTAATLLTAPESEPAKTAASETAPPVGSAATNRATTTPSPMTSTTGRRDEIAPAELVRSSNAPSNPPRASESAAPPAREVAPPSLDYQAPATLPATAPAITPNFTPLAVPSPVDARNASLTTGSATSVDPSPAAPAPGPPAAPRAGSAIREQSVAVRATLGRYESAYNHLDVAAVQSVWPSIDQRALARAFDSLTAQRVSLQNCTIDVLGATARANCSGTASWTPKIGGGEHTADRKWTFNLNQAESGWHIVQVQAR